VARPLRAFEAGIYHLAAHGSDARALFVVDDDRRDFLERLAFAVLAVGLDLLAYTLMGNHYHVLVRTPDARVSLALQRLHTGYSRRHNRIRGRSAHLFRAHCFAKAVGTDEQLLNAYRYLALNPVEAGLVLHPLDWPWSSARVHPVSRRPASHSTRARSAPPSTTTRDGAPATEPSSSPTTTKARRSGPSQ
jgi:putative transposase